MHRGFFSEDEICVTPILRMVEFRLSRVGFLHFMNTALSNNATILQRNFSSCKDQVAKHICKKFTVLLGYKDVKHKAKPLFHLCTHFRVPETSIY
jgi:hypothetical protein